MSNDYLTPEELKQEGKRALHIQAIMTVVFIVIILMVCLRFGGGLDDVYQVEKEANANEGYVWTQTIEDESILAPSNEYYVDGAYIFNYEGKNLGETKVVYTLTDAGGNVLQKDTVTYRVERGGKIVFRGMSTEKY